MRFTSRFATLAVLASGIARADTGCTLDFSPEGTTPNDEGLFIAVFNRLGESVRPIPGECLDWAEDSSSVLVRANCLSGYTTDGELETILGPWNGTYMLSRTDTPDTSNGQFSYDFLVTSVTCD